MAWLNLRLNVSRSFVTMATNLPSCSSIQFLEQLMKFLVNFTLLKYVKSQRSYGFLITKELIFGFQILDLKDHFSASLRCLLSRENLNSALSASYIQMDITFDVLDVLDRSQENKVLQTAQIINNISRLSKRW